MTRTAVPFVAIACAAALLALLAYGVLGAREDTTLDDAVRSGERPEAPAMALPVLGGEGRRGIEDYAGKVVVLNFWASWCGPCKSEAPALQAIHEELQRSGAGTVLGVTFQDTTSDSQAFVREFDLTYPSVRDVEQAYAREMGTRALPETFVIDPEGRIVAMSRGEVDRAFLQRAVAEARS